MHLSPARSPAQSLTATTTILLVTLMDRIKLRNARLPATCLESLNPITVPIPETVPTVPSGRRDAQKEDPKAKADGKLVFLSSGFDSCHWCHVMARESFADPEIAKYLNENFVCIKLDREERPDVDHIYLTALVTAGSRVGFSVGRR